MMTFTISQFRNSSSPLLTKTITDHDGKLEKDASTCLMHQGHCDQLEFDMSALHAALKTLNATQAPRNIAFGLGICDVESTAIVSEKRQADYPDALTRTKNNFKFPEGPALMLLDNDTKPGEQPLTPEQYRDLLSSIEPALADCAMVVTYSTSSGIYRKQPAGDDFDTISILNPLFREGKPIIEGQSEYCLAKVQKPVNGSGGLHAYVAVTRGTDVPRLTNLLHQRLWLKGHGYIQVSSSGQLLGRTPLDHAVASPERLIFESRPQLGEGLYQLRQDPVFFEGGVLDGTAIRDLTEHEQTIYQAAVAAAKDKARPEAEAKGRIFKEQKVKDLIERGVPTRRAQATIERAYGEERCLTGPLSLRFREFGSRCVADVLLDPTPYHQADLIDPWDDEASHRWRARLYVNEDGSIIVHSFDDGGVNYRVQRTMLDLVEGRLHVDVEQAEAILQQPSVPCIYRRGGELVRLIPDERGVQRIHPLDRYKLRLLLSRLAECRKPNRQGGLTACNPPDQFVDTIVQKGTWPFSILNGIVNHPTVSSKGELVQAEGYDRRTGLYLDFGGFSFQPIPEYPSLTDARAAVELLRRICSTFDFVSEVDFAVHVSAILTGMIRRTLSTAPLFHYGAPVPGTGKTLLASSVGLILTGDYPAVMNYTPDEDESRKRYLAFLREGHVIGLIDNIQSVLTGETLCSILTSPTFSDRLLGSSKTLTVPTNTLLLSTGNNTAILGDLARRILVCQLDPRCERPHDRRYDEDFHQTIRQHRGAIHTACLTILWAYECAGRPLRGKNSLGSFEDWSARVRNALIWTGCADPVLSLTAHTGDDETITQLGELLEAWANLFGNQAITVREAIQLTDNHNFGEATPNSILAEAISEVATGRNFKVDSRLLGSYIRKNQGRIVSGRRFVSAGEKQRAKKWRVETTMKDG